MLLLAARPELDAVPADRGGTPAVVGLEGR